VLSFTDDYDSLQSQSDAVKAVSQISTAAAVSVTSESLGPREGVDLSVEDKKPLKLADDDEVLNLVKVKEPEEADEKVAGIVTKEEDEDEKSDVKISELPKSEPADDVKKEEHEKDDDDTLSESETPTASVKPLATPADSVDTVKDEAAVKPTHKDDADEEMDHSAIPSSCPEVC